MQPSARRAPEVFSLLGVTGLLDIGDRRRFANYFAKAVDTTVFLIDRHERTVGELSAQRTSQFAQIGGAVDVAPKKHHAAWLHGIKQPSRFGAQLCAVK